MMICCDMERKSSNNSNLIPGCLLHAEPASSSSINAFSHHRSKLHRLDAVNHDSSTADDGISPIIKPNLTLPGWALFVVLGSIAAVGIGVYSLFPESVGGPPLPIEVEVKTALVDATGGVVKLTSEVVEVTNRSDEPIRHLTVIINGHYQLARQSPISPGETLTLPQSIFTDKRSSRRFNPTLADVTKVVVRGQLPKGTRGVSIFEFGESSH